MAYGYTAKDYAYYTIMVAVVIGLLIGLSVGGAFGCKSYSRYQKRTDATNNIRVAQMNANNQTKLNEIQIAQTQQLVQVEQQKAAVRVAEAKGIADAQQIINTSLTPLYLQHEAIQAQLKMAGSPNHTQVYIPSGPNGIPLIKMAP
jgi:hypothetical protein